MANLLVSLPLFSLPSVEGTNKAAAAVDVGIDIAANIIVGNMVADVVANMVMVMVTVTTVIAMEATEKMTPLFNPHNHPLFNLRNLHNKTPNASI